MVCGSWFMGLCYGLSSSLFIEDGLFWFCDFGCFVGFVLWFWWVWFDLWFGRLLGLCCDLILAEFWQWWWLLWFDVGWVWSWWWLGFDFWWVSAIVVVVWIWFWLSFDSGAWLEVMSLKSSNHGGWWLAMEHVVTWIEAETGWEGNRGDSRHFGI